MNFFFIAIILTCTLNSSLEHVGHGRRELATTKQSIPATCFSLFENLYFDSAEKTFFSVGKEAKMALSFNLGDRRGYSWKQSIVYRKTSPNLRIPGTSIFVFERGATPAHYTHFFHFLEHLLGIWNFGGEVCCNDVALFILASNGEAILDNWKGPNEVTYHLIRALFPNASIKPWSTFIQERPGRILSFEKVITSDRSMEAFKKEPYYTERMLGGYFQQLQQESLDRLASKVWHYCDAAKHPSEKLKVTYVSRNSLRFLDRACEEDLLFKIGQLPHVDLKIVDFGELSFQEQIKIVADTDVLLGAHGNGLSHTLFLPSGATLIELFPEQSFRVEYRILAQARGLDYFGWVDPSGWIEDGVAEQIGCTGNVNVPGFHVNVNAIINVLASRDLH